MVHTYTNRLPPSLYACIHPRSPPYIHKHTHTCIHTHIHTHTNRPPPSLYACRHPRGPPAHVPPSLPQPHTHHQCVHRLHQARTSTHATTVSYRVTHQIWRRRIASTLLGSWFLLRLRLIRLRRHRRLRLRIIRAIYVSRMRFSFRLQASGMSLFYIRLFVFVCVCVCVCVATTRMHTNSRVCTVLLRLRQ